MNWKLAQTEELGPEIDDWADDEEDLALGFSMMRALAESDVTLEEISPGVWRHTRRPDPGNSGPGR